MHNAGYRAALQAALRPVPTVLPTTPPTALHPAAASASRRICSPMCHRTRCPSHRIRSCSRCSSVSYRHASITRYRPPGPIAGHGSSDGSYGAQPAPRPPPVPDSIRYVTWDWCLSWISARVATPLRPPAQPQNPQPPRVPLPPVPSASSPVKRTNSLSTTEAQTRPRRRRALVLISPLRTPASSTSRSNRARAHDMDARLGTRKREDRVG